MPEPILVSRKTAAQMLDVCPNTFDRLVESGEMPAPITIRGMRRWQVSKIRAKVDPPTMEDPGDWAVSN